MPTMKTIIERGASWTLEETKLLLRLWGKDLVERQASGAKRTKEVYEAIATKFTESGHERTAEQVRTRIFNMIAEYRRILKEDNRERERKCIFFRSLHKIYNAKHMEDLQYALDDYEADYQYSPSSATVLSGADDESASENDATDGNESIQINPNAVLLDLMGPNVPELNNTNTNSKTTSNNNNTKAGSKDGDSNNNEKESTASASHHQQQQQNQQQQHQNQHHNQGTGASASTSAKKIKLDSPKPSGHSSNQVNQSATTSTSLQNSHPDNANTNTKQSKTSSVTLVATTSISGGGAVAPPSSSSSTTSATASTSASSSSSSTSTSAQRHQSLLLPHATAATTSSSSTSTTSTPISKLMTSGSNNTPSYININSTKLPILRTNPLVGHSNGNEAILNGTANRLPTTAAITSHQLYQAPVNTFDVTSSALLIDRMFAHLSRESENMREWIALEKERLALERTRRQQEAEREVRRERVLIDTLMKFQDQWLSFLARLDPRIVENANEHPPELRIPAKEAPSNDTSQTTSISTATSCQTENSSKQ